MHIEVFTPEKREPSQVVMMGSILGGTFHNTGPAEADHSYRSQWIADSLGVLVIAYERVGTGSHIDFGARRAVQPTRYARTAANTGRQLALVADRELPGKPITMVGVSSSGLETTEIARSETIQLGGIGVYDSVGMIDVTTLEGFKLWVNHQLKTEGKKPADQANQHPLPSHGLWSVAHNVIGYARSAREMVTYANLWKTPRALENLAYLATNHAFERTAVDVVFLEHTFTADPDTIARNAALLTGLRPTAFPAPYRVATMPNTWHSYTDDPARLTGLVEQTLALQAA